MSRRAARGSAIVIWGLLGGCTAPNPYLPMVDTATTTGLDAEGSTSSAGTTLDPVTGDDTSSGGTPSTCADLGMACMAVAPEGWQGPVARLEHPTDVAAECPAPFETQVVEAGSELSAPAAMCSCECGALTNASCSAVTVERYSGASCAGAVQDMEALDPGCNDLPGSGWPMSSSYTFDVPVVVSGGCFPFLEMDAPEARFLNRHLGCAGTLTTAGCEAGRVCVPFPEDPLEPRWCIWQAGDAACPAEGDYVVRTLLHRAIEDDRGCEPCSCTPPSGPCEDGSVTLSTMSSCSAQTASLMSGRCEAVASAIQGVDIEPFTVPGDACTPGVVVPTGEAAGADPVTFCCTR